MSDSPMKMGDLSKATGYSVAHLRRLATAGKIPGRYKSAGKHFRFKQSQKLSDWIVFSKLRLGCRRCTPLIGTERKSLLAKMRAERLTKAERRASLFAGEILMSERGDKARERQNERMARKFIGKMVADPEFRKFFAGRFQTTPSPQAS